MAFDSEKNFNTQESSTVTVNRRINVELVGSLMQYQQGGHEAASWAPQNGKLAACFGVDEMFDTAPGESTVQSMLLNASLKKVTALQCINNLPVSVGFTCSITPSEEVTKTGHRYALTAPAKSSNSSPLVLFESNAENDETRLWQTKYPAYNAGNLHTEGVLQVAGQPYVFVDCQHPAIEVLRMNREVLNQDIDQQQLIDNRWFKVAKQVMSTCCKELHERVLQNVNTRNLLDFKIQMHRLNGQEWMTLANNDEITSMIPREVLETGCPDKIASAVKLLQNTRERVTLRLALEYEMTKHNNTE